MYKLTSILALLGLSALGLSIPMSPMAPAPACPTNPDDCRLPSCLCSKQENPLGINSVNIPQIVYLTFDDAITVSNYPFYEEVIYPRKNPNGAPIQATFFITHEYTNYSLVHDLWRFGHDIALHSITHQSNTQYWAALNETMWNKEIIQQRQQMMNFARIGSLSDIKGMRAPFLQPGGNEMYRALVNGGMEWDCSMATYNQRVPGMFPYTKDYASTQDCQTPPCPDESFPGFWSVPMLDYLGGNQFPCAMIDECNPVPMTSDDTYNLLFRNFEDQYNGNRAPYGVFAHAAWMVGDEARPEFAERKDGYVRFLNKLAEYRDVYIVSISSALEWMKAPVPVDEIGDFTPWHEKPLPANNCLFPRNCYYTNGTWERYMSTCTPCPAEYPWIDNPLGTIGIKLYEEN